MDWVFERRFEAVLTALAVGLLIAFAAVGFLFYQAYLYQNGIVGERMLQVDQLLRVRGLLQSNEQELLTTPMQGGGGTSAVEITARLARRHAEIDHLWDDYRKTRMTPDEIQLAQRFESIYAACKGAAMGAVQPSGGSADWVRMADVQSNWGVQASQALHALLEMQMRAIDREAQIFQERRQQLMQWAFALFAAAALVLWVRIFRPLGFLLSWLENERHAPSGNPSCRPTKPPSK